VENLGKMRFEIWPDVGEIREQVNGTMWEIWVFCQ